MTDIWPLLVSALISGIAMYVGFINKMRSQISVLEDKVERMEKRQDSHSKKNDEIIKLITDFKIEMVKQLGNVVAEVGKMASDINNLNRLVTISDEEIKINKKH